MKKICSILKCTEHEGMYLYVDKGEGLSRVPEALLKQFGKPQHAMTVLLHPQKKLARVDANTVLDAIEKNGFYLQLPVKEQQSYMTDIHQKNSKF